MINSILLNLKEASEEKNVEIPEELVQKIQEDARKQHSSFISTVLSKVKKDVGEWPKAKYPTIIFQEAIKIFEETGSLQEETRVFITLWLNDNETLNQITEELRKLASIQHDDNLKDYVRDWLSEDTRFPEVRSLQDTPKSKTPTEKLIEYLEPHLPVPSNHEIYRNMLEFRRQRYKGFHDLCNSYKSHRSQRPNSCKWVPAAILTDASSICYGGVAFNTELKLASDGKPIIRPRNEILVPLERRTTSTRKQTHSTYTTPKGVSMDKSSGGHQITHTESARMTIRSISKIEAMLFRFKNPLFPFCLFANSASYTKLPNSPDFTGFYRILADSTKIFCLLCRLRPLYEFL